MVTKPKPKRRKMMSFKLDEISAVDKPAQEGATARFFKRKTPLHAMPVNYGRATADIRRLRKNGMHARANELESALALHANAIFLKSAAGESVMTLFDKARKASASAPASASAGSFAFDMNKDDDDEDIEAALAALQAEGDEEYLEPLDDEEADKAEDDIDPDELEEMEAAKLEDEVTHARTGQDMDDRSQPFEEDTEIGVEANRQMRDKRTSKRTAFSKAVARAIAKRGGYDAVFTKASSTISTDSAQPFHQQRAPQRRAEMDRRTVATRNAANAELAAMREGASMGREMEEKRRMIDGMVLKLRTVDPRMRHQDALRKIRGQYPSLFG